MGERVWKSVLVLLEKVHKQFIILRFSHFRSHLVPSFSSLPPPILEAMITTQSSVPTQLGRRYECTISGEISAISNLDHLKWVFSRFFYMVGKILVSSTKSIL